MKANNKALKFILSIILGIAAFIGLNIAYALFSIQAFSIVLKIALFVIPIILLIISLLLKISSEKSSGDGCFKIKHLFNFGFVVIAGGWLTLVCIVCFFQYDFLYTNSPVIESSLSKIQQQNNKYEKITIETSDKVKLQGFLAKNKDLERAPLAIYFGGRGEEAAFVTEYGEKIKGWSLAFIDYRGCGLSESKQSEEKTFKDAAEIYDYFKGREDINTDKIVLIAHSLGTGVAIHLASERNVQGVVLSAPYDVYSTGVIQDRLPMVPTSLIFTDKYDSLSIAPKVKTPALFLIAENDKTVLKKRSIKLYENWGGKAEKVIIEDAHHENITLKEKTWNVINEFLSKI